MLFEWIDKMQTSHDLDRIVWEVLFFQYPPDNILNVAAPFH